MGADLERCLVSGDCTKHAGGQCSLGAFAPYAVCFYDECYEDAHCAADQVCDCSGIGDPQNRCVDSNCHVDADCGEGRHCVRSPGGCGPDYPVAGYYCESSEQQDDCVQDSDCTAGDAYCLYDRAAQRWRCATQLCAGRGA